MPKPKQRFLALDSWRGIGALGVAMFHCSIYADWYYLGLIRNGGVFVDFFFVLSGFVIMHAYGDRLHDAQALFSFLLRRFGRLWPLHAFLLGILVLLEIVKLALVQLAGISAGDPPFGGASPTLGIPAHLLLIHSLGLFDDYTWNGPSWSISVEFWTYVTFGILCWLSCKKITVLGVVISIVSAAILVRFHHGIGATYDFGLFRCFCGFFTGVITYKIHCQRPRFLFSPNSWEALATALVIAYVTFMSDLKGAYGLSSFLCLFVFGFTILVFAQERGRISSLLKARVMEALGRWSYSIYMVHFVLITVMNGGVRMLQQIMDVQIFEPYLDNGQTKLLITAPYYLGNALFLAYMAAVIALSAVTYRYIEKPGQTYFNGLARCWYERPPNPR